MASRYQRYLGPTLTEAVKNATSVDPDEQAALYDELALMREYAGGFVALYSASVESKDPKAIMMTGVAMKDALESVASICDKAGKLQAKAKDRFSIHDLKHVIDKIMVIHARVFRNHPKLVQVFADAIAAELIIPQDLSLIHISEPTRPY